MADLFAYPEIDPMSMKDHQVWDVYDLLRTARLNQLYYGRRLQTFERRNFGQKS